jgi:hypothetical protein
MKLPSNNAFELTRLAASQAWLASCGPHSAAQRSWSSPAAHLNVSVRRLEDGLA